MTDTEAVLAALDGARVLWLESPTNPMLGIAELPRLLEAARAARVFSVVDNTFATPVLQQPLALGADAVLHSATKYLGGHSDLVMGVVVTANPYRGPGQYTGTTTVVQVHNLDNSGVWQSGAADPVAFAVNNDEESGTLQATLTSVANGTGKLKVSGRWACKT